jgi:ABC-type multidrug transport system permease subunit
MGNPANFCERLFSLLALACAGMAVFRHFLHLARRLQYPWHGAGSSGAGSGRKTMTFNANISHLAVSIVGALVAATLFVSAAVGPAGQLI